MIRNLLAVALALAAPQLLAQADRGGKEVVDSVCSACHAAGDKGAPKIGDRAAWNPRLKVGLDNIVRSAIRGHGGMPARGGQAALTDSEFKAAVTYMVNPVDAPSKGAAKGAAARSSQSKTVGGLDIHLGLVAAEKLSKSPEGSAERKMHGGVPKGTGYYHLNVTLLDQAGKPVNAKVEARVEQPGMSGETKALEPVTLSGIASHGAYFKLLPKTRYVVIVRAQRADAAQPLEARFEHRTN